jgi:hypothetical protein
LANKKSRGSDGPFKHLAAENDPRQERYRDDQAQQDELPGSIFEIDPVFPAFPLDSVQFRAAFTAHLGLARVLQATRTALNEEMPLALSTMLRLGVIHMLALGANDLCYRM